MDSTRKSSDDTILTLVRESFTTDRYEVLRLLGKGGMGVVYEAYDRELNTKVALKTLPDASGAALLRFKNEFRALQDLQHPNLVTLGELTEHDGKWFFTMELVRGVHFLSYVWGTDPMQLMERTTAISPKSDEPAQPLKQPPPSLLLGGREGRLRAALAQLFSGLNALHGASKVHRDVKPGNVLVAQDGRVVLLDFGLITERARDDLSQQRDVVGTVSYMAPEQAAGLPAQPASDIYAVGVMLYEALTGRLPFSGSPEEVLRRKQVEVAPHPGELVDELAPDLADHCAALLHLDPTQRPSADEVCRRLRTQSDASSLFSLSSRSCDVFVGQDRELDILGRSFDEVASGRAVMVLVHGQSGVGKTSLISEFVRRQSAAADILVLRGRCFERESVPFKGFDGVVDALAHHLAALPEGVVEQLVPPDASVLLQAFPVLSRVTSLARREVLSRVGDPLSARARVFSALRDLLRRLAVCQPLIVAIDDMQWADADSIVLLQALLAEPEAPALLLLLSAREQIDLFADDGARARVLELRPLGEDAATQLAQALLTMSDAPDTSDAVAIAREAEGHPLYIAELAQLAAVPRASGQAPRLRDAILYRAAALGDDEQRLLQLIAISAGPLPLPAMRQAMAVDAASFAYLVGTLRIGNLVRCSGGVAPTVEPYHDHVRESVAASVSEATARRHHARLAAALVGHDAQVRPELLLHHLEGAGEHTQAAKHADEAACRATAAFAFLRAAELLRVAIRLGSYTRDEQRALRRRLADALSHAGHGAAAAEEFMLAADGADPTSSLECRARAARVLVSTGRVARGVKIMESVLDDLGIALPRSASAAVAALIWQRAKLTLRGRHWKVRYEHDIPKHDLAMVDAMRAVAEALGLVDVVRANVLQQRLLIMTLQLGEPKRVIRALGMESLFLAAQGERQLGRARRLVEETKSQLTAIRSQIDDSHWATTISIGLHQLDGVLSFFTAEFENAATSFAAADAACRRCDVYNPIEVNTIQLFLLGSLRELGAMARWREVLPSFLREADQRGDLLAHTSLRRVSIILRLADDDSEGARSDLASTSWPTPPGQFHMQDWMELQARVEIALYERNVADIAEWALGEFDRLHRSLLYYARPLRLPINALWGRTLLAISSGASNRHQMLRKARRIAKKLRADRAPHSDVWALLIDAAVAVGNGERDRSMRLLERAEQDGDALGLGICATAARVRRAALIGGDEGAALRAEAKEWQRREGVVNLERLVEVMAPGFAPDD